MPSMTTKRALNCCTAYCPLPTAYSFRPLTTRIRGAGGSRSTRRRHSPRSDHCVTTVTIAAHSVRRSSGDITSEGVT